MRETLRDLVLDIFQTNNDLSISELEDKLRLKNIKFFRDDLRSVVWRLASAQTLRISPESRIVFCTNGKWPY
jgi:hypothetical protein